MKKRIITSGILIVVLCVVLSISYFWALYTLACKTTLARPEVQWALEHPEEVKATKASYESVHKAADEVFYSILEQGKE